MQKIYGAKERQDGLYPIGRNKYEVIFGFWKDAETDESGYNLRKRYDHKPANTEILNDIFEFVNSECDAKIVSGHTFKGMPVWLSAENQKNYESARNIARDTNGASLPETFKFGGDFDMLLYEFTTVEELEEFYIGCYNYVKQCLAECWAVKYDALQSFPVVSYKIPAK